MITTCEGAFLTSKKLSAREMACWKSKIKNSSTIAAELWRNAGLSAFSVAGGYVGKNSSGDEMANVNFYAMRPEATRIR